jgi:hypothetical protein
MMQIFPEKWLSKLRPIYWFGLGNHIKEQDEIPFVRTDAFIDIHAALFDSVENLDEMLPTAAIVEPTIINEP